MKVPSAAFTGPIRVTTPSGTALSAPFTVQRTTNSYTFTANNTFTYSQQAYNGNQIYSTPTFTDIDRDGLIDLIIGTYDGNIELHEQNAVNSGTFAIVNKLFIPSTGVRNTSPTITDLDGDGLFDIIVGNGDGFLKHYKQNASNSLAFTLQAGDFLNTSFGKYAAPTVSDLDGDGLLDFLIGMQDGSLQHFEQDAANGLTFTRRTAATGTFSNIDINRTHGNAQPKVLDLDGDGLLDLVIGGYNGFTYYFEQTAANALTFDGGATLIGDIGDLVTPAFTDINGDGLLDLALGEWNSNMTFYSQQASPKADVGVTLSTSGGPYTVGKTLTFTVMVTNSGPNAASGITVKDLLDPAKFQNITSTDPTYDAANRTWNVGSLVANASKTLTITAQPLATGTISILAKQAHAEVDLNTTNDSQTASITVVPSADIEVKNVASKAVYYSGEVVEFTISAKNLGPNVANNVVVQSKLPTNLYISGTVPSGYDSLSGNWTVGTLALNETKTLILKARQAASNLGSFTSTATLLDRGTNEADLNTNNNTSSTTITISPAADIAITNAVSTTTPTQGATFTYTIKATNNGPNNASNVVISGTVPAGLTFSGATPTSGSATIGAGTISWNAGLILKNTTQTLVLTAISNTVGAITYSMSQTHTEYDSNTGNNSASQTINVAPTADIKVENLVTSTPVVAGKYSNDEVVTYQVNVTNNGPSSATNVKVKDLLPSTLKDITFTAPSGSTYSATSGEWLITSLTSGSTTTLLLNAKVKESAVINTSASLVSLDQFDNVTSNNSASNTIQAGTGTITADIAVTASVGAGTYYTQSPITFTVRATNNGPDAGTNLSFNAPLPAGFTFVSASGNYSNGIWTVASLASGDFTELTLVGKPNVNTSTSSTADINYTFTAARTGTFAQADNATENNTSSVNVTVKKQADIVTKMKVTSERPDGKFYHNQTIATFYMTVVNNGPDVVTNLVGRDTRTGNINPVGLSLSQGTYSYADGIWTIGTLQPGDSVTLTLRGIPNTTGRMNLGGRITGVDQYDPTVENNSTVTLLNVLPVAEVAVTNTLETVSPYNGGTATFTVKVLNNGPDAATAVKVQDVLPAGLTYVSSETSSGAYDATSGIWTLGTDLLSGASHAQTMTLTAKINGSGAFSTTASILEPATEYDQIAANNSATAGGMASKAADVVVTSVLPSGPYYATETFTLVIEATNLGPDNATLVKIAHDLTGLKQWSATPSAGGTYDLATRTWTINDLTSGDSNKATLTLVVSPLEIGFFSNSAYKTGGNEFDSNGGNTSSGNNSALASGQAEAKPSLLPVTLTIFTGKAQTQGILLNWATASEKNSAYFAVQRSTDGKIFTSIGKVTSAGNSSQLVSYQFLDTTAPTGVVYYRLHQVDFDGAFEDSKVIAVQQKAKQPATVKVNVFPNPSAANPTLNLSSLPAETFVVTIYNMNGQLVKQAKFMGGASHVLDVQQMAVGQYIIQVTNSSMSQTVKFIKQ
ncbi:FG-GAP-like repeat-containing protein [Rufibacter sp. DG15C]|uniref:FG-GAP-like repeat-containing protein n=1 Tax=Rufibacter sp. DG15C TaxID=1379909 RepID=UPI0018D3C89C|nr:FG-GAP-like repeat-containing protein [Rufibacter sp. DG15C]